MWHSYWETHALYLSLNVLGFSFQLRFSLYLFLLFPKFSLLKWSQCINTKSLHLFFLNKFSRLRVFKYLAFPSFQIIFLALFHIDFYLLTSFWKEKKKKRPNPHSLVGDHKALLHTHPSITLAFFCQPGTLGTHSAFHKGIYFCSTASSAIGTACLPCSQM